MGDHVFLKVMPKRGVVRFDKREKAISEVYCALQSTRVRRHGYIPVGFTIEFIEYAYGKYTPDPTHGVD